MAPVVVFLTFLAAISSLVAAWCCYKLVVAINPGGPAPSAPDRVVLGNAATALTFTLVLAAAAAFMAIYVST